MSMVIPVLEASLTYALAGLVAGPPERCTVEIWKEANGPQIRVKWGWLELYEAEVDMSPSFSIGQAELCAAVRGHFERQLETDQWQVPSV